jgi:hypothetical protein
MTAEVFRDGGRTFVRFTLSDYYGDDSVSVVGSFNGWMPGTHVLTQAGQGVRTVTAEITHPGDVHFRYLATGGRWFDDPTADVIDEYGSTLRIVDPTPDREEPAEKAATKKAPTKKAASKTVKKAPAKKAAEQSSAASSSQPRAAKKASAKKRPPKT